MRTEILIILLLPTMAEPQTPKPPAVPPSDRRLIEHAEVQFLSQKTDEILRRRGILLNREQRNALFRKIRAEYPCTVGRAYLMCRPPRRTPNQVIDEHIQKMFPEMLSKPKESKLKTTSGWTPRTDLPVEKK